jgi:hypothetical protein
MTGSALLETGSRSTKRTYHILASKVRSLARRDWTTAKKTGSSQVQFEIAAQRLRVRSSGCGVSAGLTSECHCMPHFLQCQQKMGIGRTKALSALLPRLHASAGGYPSLTLLPASLSALRQPRWSGPQQGVARSGHTAVLGKGGSKFKSTSFELPLEARGYPDQLRVQRLIARPSRTSRD